MRGRKRHRKKALKQMAAAMSSLSACAMDTAFTWDETSQQFCWVKGIRTRK